MPTGRPVRIGIRLTVMLLLLVGLAGVGRAQTRTGLEPAAIVDWIAVGGVTPRSLVLTTHLREPAHAVQILISRHADFSDGTLVGPAQEADTDRNGNLLRFQIGGLRPGTHYHMAVVADGQLDEALPANVRTFPDGPASFRVAMGADVSPTGVEHDVFPTILAGAPDLLLLLGDLFVDDPQRDDPERFRRTWSEVRGSRSLARLLSGVPMAYVWDDHDYGDNNGDRTSPARRAARLVYHEHVPHYPYALDGLVPDKPIAQAFTVGRVRFILTDLRSERSPNHVPDGPAKSMLGDRQRSWFFGELERAAEDHALVVWANPSPWITAVEAGADHWGGFSTERAEIARRIRDAGVPVVIVSGDAHMVAIDDGRHSDFTMGATNGRGSGPPVLHASALSAGGKIKGGPYSHGAQPNREGMRDGQFATMEITDWGGPRICLAWTGWRLESDTGQLVKLRRLGQGRTGPLLAWSRCWPTQPVAGAGWHRLALPSLSRP